MNAYRLSKFANRVHAGFTLVELVAVIVVLSIIAVIGGGFIIKGTETYRSSMVHAQLTQQARQALERASRELRHALPNSIRIGGDCIEWLPVVGVGRYQGEVAGRAINTLDTTPIRVSLQEAHYLSIGALSAEEVYSSNAKALRYLESVIAEGNTVTSLSVAASTEVFPRDSVGKRVFLVGQPKQLCMRGGRFTLHENYTGSILAATLVGIPPPRGVLLAHLANSPHAGFELDSSSDARNTIVRISLPLEQAGNEILLQHKVMIRNVP